MSLRLRLLKATLRSFARPLIARVADPALLRRPFDRVGKRILRPAPFSLLHETELAPKLSALVVSNRPGSHPVRLQKVVLHFHGGAFIAGHPPGFAGMLAQIARLTRCEVIAPDYRLAPEHPFPAAVDDARAAWDGLIARGYRPEDVVIGGDSAGGNLALGLLAALLAEGARPAGLYAFSPVTDLTFSGPSIAANEATDPLLPASRRDDMLSLYLQGIAPDDPRASPLLADFAAPPPVFLQFSETEILADDSRRMAAKLRAAGAVVTLDPWPDAPHVWVLFDGFIPEAREALKRAAAFVNARFDGDQAKVSEVGRR